MIQNAAAKIEQDQLALDTAKHILAQRQAQKLQLNADIAALEQDIAGIESTRDMYVAALTDLSYKGELINGDLNATVDNVVTDLELYRINHSDDSLQLSGQAANEEEVMAYDRNLQDTGRFAEITISSLTRVTDSDNATEYMSYSLAVKLERGQ
jgi:Tfp pilus assembly protein PilN